MLTLQNKVCTTYVGSQHGFFNQLMCVIAHTWNDFVDASTFITHDLCFSGFKIHRTAHATCFEQRAIHIVKVNQIVNAVFSLGSFWPACIRQNRRYFVVCEARMTEHHGRIKLIRLHIT